MDANTTRSALTQCVIHYASEHPELDLTLVDPGDLEDMSCLLLQLLNLHFSMIKLPVRFRPPLFALIGVSAAARKDSEDWFYLRDRELAVQLLSDQGRTAAAMKQQIARFRKGFMEWQAEHGLNLVSIEPGKGKVKRDEQGKVMRTPDDEPILIPVPSRYKLNLLHAAFRIIQAYEVTTAMTRREIRKMAKQLEREIGMIPVHSNPTILEPRDRLNLLKRRTIETARRALELAGELGEQDEIRDELVFEIKDLLTPVDEYLIS